MSKKYHTDSVTEYMFLKSEVMKMLGKINPKATLEIKKAKKRAKKFIVRMKAIETYHLDMGWAHPEAHFKPRADLQKELEAMKQTAGKPVLANPDGSLYQKDNMIQSGEGFIVSTKSITNPDGTPFETPVMDGSILNPTMHSEKKIQEYLQQRDDGALRTEE